jgi:NAD(P)-dependent dehydrogenase (short-subunit alcohol dehydrogenase family)
MKVALVTGANQGIGFETSKELLRRGYRVWLGCRNSSSAEKALKELGSEGLGKAEWLPIDVTDKASIDEAAALMGKSHPVLDLLINNAGILGPRPTAGEPYPVEEIMRVFDTNVFGVMRVTQAFLPLLSRSDSPRIVNVSSGLGSLTKQSDPDWAYGRYKHPAYVPSKAALNAYTVLLSAQLAPKGFKVNSVDPGHTATGFNAFNPEGRSPAESAAFVVQAAIMGQDGPTGRFLSEADPSGELPW